MPINFAHSVLIQMHSHHRQPAAQLGIDEIRQAFETSPAVETLQPKITHPGTACQSSQRLGVAEAKRRAQRIRRRLSRYRLQDIDLIGETGIVLERIPHRHGDAAAGFEYTPHLRQRLHRVGKKHQAELAQHAIETPVRKRQGLGTAEIPVESGADATRDLQHSGRNIETRCSRRGAGDAGDCPGNRAGAAGNIEHPIAGLDPSRLDYGRNPGLKQGRNEFFFVIAGRFDFGDGGAEFSGCVDPLNGFYCIHAYLEQMRFDRFTLDAMSASHHNPKSDSLDPASGERIESAETREIRSTEEMRGDPMSDVLEAVRLRGALFFLWEPSKPYGVGVADGKQLSRHIVPGTDSVISYHIVARGPCWATVVGEEPMRLDTGDILVLPHGDAYKIADTPQFPTAEDAASSIEFFSAMAAGEIPPVVGKDGGEPGNKLICGFLGCNFRPFNPLLSSLPRMIRVSAPDAGTDPLTSLIDFALSETRQAQGGERCLLMRLSELMFIEVLRRYLRSSDRIETGWLAGLRDPITGRALDRLHRNLAEHWTLQTLAQSVGASRSTLAERFTSTVGIPPMQYLTQWRMQVAANLLLDKSTKIYAVAREVGYDSEAAFSRAFKRVAGVSPRRWRD